ncbi:uncharacterized protein PHACADRAFT_177788 [Phanerochaete carnosa HHB-10118-sp]|uniref:SigF-like NTF2-like domain-containing protein n=1 Tax=Phanerochaete carnosa (strain HHB-10118-sp) TaxID=650164 RepID=K5UMZ8_PHACS|nr:uncharacterized protein PHACADRAFT_177788 [Phanerochaete carnosa HHB-10118-sp]EKM51096.1 hypothetical protein PHACADRAFT_177788 [Phanerochaete carnosa HHB-10118-sp]
MQDPQKEIPDVVNLITAAVNPEIQEAAVLRYYAPDAAFRHPLCRVWRRPGSRSAVIGILQWYRIMSPVLKIDVRSCMYNAEKHEAYIEVVQVFHIRYSPLAGYPSRLIVHLKLKPSVDDPSLLQIAEHEDFYHPDDLMALVIPPLIPVVCFLLWLGTVMSVIGARFFQATFGYWRIRDRESDESVDLTKPEVNGTNTDS